MIPFLTLEWICVHVCESLSGVWLFVTWWTVACPTHSCYYHASFSEISVTLLSSDSLLGHSEFLEIDPTNFSNTDLLSVFWYAKIIFTLEPFDSPFFTHTCLTASLALGFSSNITLEKHQSLTCHLSYSPTLSFSVTDDSSLFLIISNNTLSFLPSLHNHIWEDVGSSPIGINLMGLNLFSFYLQFYINSSVQPIDWNFLYHVWMIAYSICLSLSELFH